MIRLNLLYGLLYNFMILQLASFLNQGFEKHITIEIIGLIKKKPPRSNKN